MPFCRLSHAGTHSQRLFKFMFTLQLMFSLWNWVTSLTPTSCEVLIDHQGFYLLICSNITAACVIWLLTPVSHVVLMFWASNRSVLVCCYCVCTFDKTFFNCCLLLWCYNRDNLSRMVHPPSILDDFIDPDSVDELEDVTGMKCCLVIGFECIHTTDSSILMAFSRLTGLAVCFLEE